MANQLITLTSDQNQIISQNLSNVSAQQLGFNLSVMVAMGDIFILMKFSGITELLHNKGPYVRPMAVAMLENVVSYPGTIKKYSPNLNCYYLNEFRS